MSEDKEDFDVFWDAFKDVPTSIWANEHLHNLALQAWQAANKQSEARIKELEAYAKRYRFLRNQTINEDLLPPKDGLFIGQIPQNLVLTAENADNEIDSAMEKQNEPTNTPS